MFGSQRVPNNPKYSHTFATFVRACWEGDGPCPENPTLEAHTISWLPRTGVVRDWAVFPECGRNFELHETIRWSLDNDMRISLWGAYRIEPELYARAVSRIAELESGAVRYKANDLGYPNDRVSNCIHGVGALGNGLQVRPGSPGWGEPASYFVLKKLERWVIGRACPHPWVGSALGLDKYPIIYRDYTHPRSAAYDGPIFRLLGGERDLVPMYGPPRN